MNIAFYDLSDKPELLQVVAQWAYDQWWSSDPYKTVEMVAESWKKRIADKGIPLTIVGELDRKPIGMVSLVECDVGMEHRMELSPWVAAVYVVPSFRRKGVGGMLLKKITARAAAMSIPRVYLYTHDQSEFYKSHGWAILEREKSGTGIVDILYKNLSVDNCP